MIDWNRVSELRDEIGQEDFSEVAELFLDETDAEIAALRDPAQQGGLAARLHFLKGSALNLGFSDFAGLCQTAEVAAAHGATADIDLADILACYDASKTAFLADLSRRSDT